ncbi:MAG TPA: hypothetical protein VFS00_21575, partial [Polyangiaceae bacterium]|nr:hypothetical protein [Polyangiaceae bacterium]
MKAAPPRRLARPGEGEGWRRRLPSGAAAGKALALGATLAFVTLVGLRAGPAASRPAAPAAPSASTPALAPEPARAFVAAS